jgi:uncharacterized protein (TIRG00374 family)
MLRVGPDGAGRKPATSRWLKFAAALGVSVLFSYLFIRKIDLNEVGDAVAGADYFYVIPAMVLFAASVCARSLRWRYFLLPQPDLTWRQLLPSVLVGYAGNNLLPLRAGELVRAQYLADHHAVPRMQTFGALLMERLFDSAVLATFVLWGLLVVDIGTAYLGLGLALAAGSLAGFIVCGLIARNPTLPERLARLPLPFIGPRLRDEIASLGSSFFAGFSVLRSPSGFVLAAATTAAAWGLELSMYWLISEAFDLNASFITIAFAGSAANVAMSLPSAQGGVGPFQYFATEALVKFHIAASTAAAYALALHLFLVVPVSVVGLIVLWRSTLPGQQRARVGAAAVEAPD